jgi:lipopolysaccharide/colanic/teichoic acid biosynthesis glycosyltransferase
MAADVRHKADMAVGLRPGGLMAGAHRTEMFMTFHDRRPAMRSAAAARPEVVQGRAPGGIYRGAVKRAIDVAAILLALPIVLPIVAALAALVALDGSRPFYSQQRIGKDGRIYRMWKLRSMVRDADACLEAHLDADPQLRDEWDSKQKLRDDPRITRLGRMLRKSSIDELPQLFNVLMGHMSLVGPRPMMVSQKVLYPGTDYYDLRPGITGLWQISDRNETTFADRARYDARYNADLTLTTDLRILVATVRVVLRGTGC